MPKTQLTEEKLTGSAVGAFYDVYNNLGFGHFEHIYKSALERKLIARGHEVGREVPVMVTYKGEALAMERLDTIIDARLVVESNRQQSFTRRHCGRPTVTCALPTCRLAWYCILDSSRSSIASLNCTRDGLQRRRSLRIKRIQLIKRILSRPIMTRVRR